MRIEIVMLLPLVWQWPLCIWPAIELINVNETKPQNINKSRSRLEAVVRLQVPWGVWRDRFCSHFQLAALPKSSLSSTNR